MDTGGRRDWLFVLAMAALGAGAGFAYELRYMMPTEPFAASEVMMVEELQAGGALYHLRDFIYDSGVLPWLEGLFIAALALSVYLVLKAYPMKNRWTEVARGALSGAAFVLLWILWSYTERGYYRVLDSITIERAGDIPLVFGAALLAALLGAIFGGLVLALCAGGLDSRERMNWLGYSVGLLVATICVIMLGYAYASQMYDINKGNLSEALGVPSLGMENLTVLDPAMKTVNRQYVPVSSGAMQKMKAYLEGGRTKYYREALLKLEQGCCASLDFDCCYSTKRKLAGFLSYHRLALVESLKRLSTTPAKALLINTYADEGRWVLGAEASLELARAYISLNEISKASAMLDRARKAGASEEALAEVVIPESPVLTKGTIRGRLVIGPLVPGNHRSTLGLFMRSQTNEEPPSTREDLVASMLAGQGGGFEFTDLVQGQYRIKILTSPEVVPYEGAAVTFHNPPPASITLDREHPVADLGVMDVRVSR